jgi:hypothetical protein
MAQLNRDIIIQCMREAINKLEPGSPRRFPTFSNFMNATLAELASKRLIPGDAGSHEYGGLRSEDPLALLLTECYQQLLVLGYIIPQPAPPNAPNPNRIWVTEGGREWASGSDPIPEDQDGYLSALDSLVPNLDPTIREYAKEAIITYSRRAFFSSAVMIGAASEKAFYLLMEALVGALTNSGDKKSVQKTMNERRLPAMFKCLSKFINDAKTKGALPYIVHEGADRHCQLIAC